MKLQVKTVGDKETQEGPQGCTSLNLDSCDHTQGYTQALSKPKMEPAPASGHGALPATPPETAWDRSIVAPSRLAAWWPRTSWLRGTRAALQGLQTTRPGLSTFYFLLVIFVLSTVFHSLRRLALVPAPWASSALVVLAPRNLPQEGMFTINVKGRLGNQMGEYATLFALARMNGRPAFIPAAMHSALAPIFRISLPVLHGDTDRRIPWQNYHLNDWMEERYRHIPGRYVRLTGYPCSWTFYHHLRPEILQEFTLHDHVREEAQAFLRGLRVNGSQPSTFVGVHVRRGDYVHVMPNVWKGVVADRGYLKQALDRFRARYPSPVFVVTSDDMAWCRKSISISQGDVAFAGNGLRGSPARDLALLTQCNHTIITVGTFGVWAAYLTGGDTVYLANFTQPNSPFHRVFKPQAAYLPNWVGIAADLGQAQRSNL
ncbi:galactoside 2-alpha-L-fucosyltransferase Sec1 isoform X1 [Peromyscus maniculatus bairdii]|uniref:galactoside 2-alpha-L-fucosyltransferase Sec1 isoform X1 n=2 Tax=Peromyscus maniculatus bairdii TaxID=230844 RepID=UPI00077DC832|nr:galactoside 2-alpha-L-fucosyltransferase Sec1 isoform X4 [Peromyscus maniculatus bairdii]